MDEIKTSIVTRQLIRDLRGRKDIDKTIVGFLVDDFKKRDSLGWKKYGKPLDHRDEAHDWLVELEEEILDACQYSKAEILRRESKKQRHVSISCVYQELLTLLVRVKTERENLKRGRHLD